MNWGLRVCPDSIPDTAGNTVHSALSGGAIAGVTITVVVAVLALMLLLVWKLRPDLVRNPFSKERPQEDPSPEKFSPNTAGELSGNAAPAMPTAEMPDNSARYELSGFPAQHSELPAPNTRQ
jgi:hypothetical protein